MRTAQKIVFTALVLTVMAPGVVVAQSENLSEIDSLIQAISANQIDRAEQLLKKGVSWNVRGSRKETAWCHALARGRTRGVELLLKYGADKNHSFQPPCRITTAERPVHLAT